MSNRHHLCNNLIFFYISTIPELAYASVDLLLNFLDLGNLRGTGSDVISQVPTHRVHHNVEMKNPFLQRQPVRLASVADDDSYRQEVELGHSVETTEIGTPFQQQLDMPEQTINLKPTDLALIFKNLGL